MARPDVHFDRPVDGTGLPHDPFNAIVGPRPIGWISSIDRAGIRNLAPYRFFNGFNYHPPRIILFSSIGWKNTVANIDTTGEFVWNLATRQLATQMNQTAATLPAEHDEFESARLTPVPSTVGLGATRAGRSSQLRMPTDTSHTASAGRRYRC